MDTEQSAYNMVQQFSRRLLINESVALRLLNSVSSYNRPVPSEPSLMSVCSSNEFGHSCRICRWHRNDLLIQPCPCRCKGSVGYVHLKCLRRWMLHRNDDHCEICGTKFMIMPEKWSYVKQFWSFFQSKYLGAILKSSIHLMALAPISYVILYQVLQVMDNLQLEENADNALQFHMLALAPAILLTSSIIFFHILEFSVTRCLIIKNALRHWWKYGGLESDPGLDMEVPSELFEFF